jgi:hypothetical protein
MLTTSPPSVSRLSRKCENLNFSQPYGPSRPLKGIIALPFTIVLFISQKLLVTVAERSVACTVFTRTETGIVGSNPTQGMGCLVCVCVHSVFVLSRV